METLKTQRVLEAKQKMQNEKKKIGEEKNRLLEDTKNRLAQNRPNGAGGNSMVGENFIDFMNSSPQSLKIAKSRAGGSASLRTSPKGANASPLLKIQQVLKLQH